MDQEATLVIIKPDGLKKSLTGNILTRLSEAKLKIIGAKVVEVKEDLANAHYRHLQDKPFFQELIKYISGKLHGENRVMPLVYWGENAIGKVRRIAGATNPEEADPISIRGAYGRILTTGLYENVIHASSDPSEAEREIKLWFGPDEIVYDLYPALEKQFSHESRRVWQ
ncbi:MAG: nucleoside-diphosphate kinase [Candidatus Omnitrophica bacterium]|nr:nucleoside-diphosphate kinase [Candidatus Omnitrophota bacterium]MCF7877562.1 nucleoside-diphosphate kinase [Candidatus Omnitrophota bacterium]MCF7877967.1 nucleoside-diphosphate kinase [Candidatus Omnitrophota bacterium]MCF7892714.1 nucleoside-diphosphate kinase [Candidatus Omnitrophota bacterium]